MELNKINEYWHLLEAAKQGKTIQMKTNDGWIDFLKTDSMFLFHAANQYRIKPEVVHMLIDKSCFTICGSDCDNDTTNKSKVTCPDCLAKMLPEWIKAGAKCFYDFGPTGIKLVKIDKILENGRVSFLGEKEKCGGVAHYSSLSPAVLRPPTYESLSKLMPLAVKYRGSNCTQLVLSVNSESVLLPGVKENRIVFFEDLAKEHTYTDGSEIGEWVKK